MTVKKTTSQGNPRTGQLSVQHTEVQKVPAKNLTKLEKQARREASQSIRTANFSSSYGVGGFGGYGGMGGGGNITNADSAFYSPQLSTDFLEMPQSEREKRELFRFWYKCFVPGTPVLVSDGTTTPIEDLRVGDFVPNGFGVNTRIKNIFVNHIKDNIVEIKVRGIQDKIKSTGNHPFFVLRGEEVDCDRHSSIGACKQGEKSFCKRIKCSGKNFNKPEYIYSKDLKVGDYIISPPMKDTIDCGLSRAEIRLLGYYAAEGSIAYRSKGVVRGVEFSLNINEESTIAREISDLFYEVYGKNARIYPYEERGSLKVVCDGVGFAKFCEKWVGRGSHNKQLKEELVKGLPDQILEFLGSYWNGDGCFTDNSYTANTVSINLASQVYQMLRRLNIPAYNSKYNRPSRTIKNVTYPEGIDNFISFPGRYFDLFSKYANFVNGKYNSDSTRIYLTHCEYGFLHRIESLNIVFYEGPVHNIEVEGEGDEKSYIAHGLATHNTHPIVGAAIDFHTDVPMSKIRLSLPKSKDIKKAKKILHFYEQMCKRVKLFQVLYDATHEYWLQGMVYLFCEDHDMSSEISEEDLFQDTEEEVVEIDYAGRSERRIQKSRIPVPDKEREEIILNTVKEKYQGWQRIQILPPEQVRLEVFQYTDKTRMELIPSDKDRQVVLRAEQNDDRESRRIADDIPDQIKQHLLEGQPIPLNTSPYDDFLCSSFCYHLSHHKSSYENHGTPILERCHLPGTEITARRGGQILQIPIEDLDPETDQVLGGSGVWRNFDHGTRPVSESVTEIHVEKVLDPIRLTFDHKMGVIRDDIDMDVLASEVLPGDYVQISQVGLTESVSSINLADFIRSIAADLYVGRKSGEISSLSMMIVDETEESFTVQYSKTETDPKKASYSDKIESVLDWLSGLTEPVTISGTKFCERFGFYPSDKTKIRAHLAELGVSSKVVRVGARHLTTFNPLQNRTEVDRSRNVTKVFHKTISLDSDFGYLIGYWLGDGWIRKNSSTLDYGQFGICYSTKSPRSCASADYLKPILDKLGVKWSEVVYGPTKKMIQILGYNDIFTRWLATNFGHTKDDKHLPDWLFDAPKDFLFGVIRGLIDSDGCVTVKKTGVVTVQLAMSTKPLMDQIVLLMQSLGLPPSVHLHKSRDVKMPDGTVTKDCRPLWQASFSDSEAVSSLMGSGFLAKKIDVRVPENLGWGRKHRIIDGKLHYRVKSVSSFSYDGPVYSMDVDEDHSFYANRIWHANCLRTLLYQDKLRQAQTSIASRAMTPKRVIWADKASAFDVEMIREQVDQALIDPDFTIIANYELHWDEIGSRDRLLDLSNEYEITNKMLYIGLRITESMLTGESSYSGERIHLDVMNTMYLLYRETLSTFVEEQLFAPVAEKKEFYEEDEFGNKILLYPKLQFTRLALRDNTELLDFMFNLYQKGSMPISYIYDLLNIDSTDAHEELLKDFLTIKDSSMNEFIRELLSNLGSKFAEDSDAAGKIADNLRLKLDKPEKDRFSK